LFIACIIILTILCRLKILESKRGRIYDIKFVDPYIVNEHSLHNHAKDIENNLVWVMVRGRHPVGVGTLVYHPEFPLCIQFMIPGRPS
jgi:hypothetical protein